MIDDDPSIRMIWRDGRPYFQFKSYSLQSNIFWKEKLVINAPKREEKTMTYFSSGW
jgi:hypothetical protein